MLGFFVSGDSNSYSANTNSAMTISANYTFSSSTLTGGYSVTLDYNLCSPSTGTPSIGDLITLYYDFTYPCGAIDNYMILTYQIQSFSAVSLNSYSVTLDRTVPDYSTITGCTGEGRAFIYSSGMTPFYDVTTPQNYFALPCATTPQVNIWNMNIPWSESPAGLIETSYQGYRYFGSIDYIGSKEYLGYQTDNGQYFIDSSGITATTDTFYFNSLGDRKIGRAHV